MIKELSILGFRGFGQAQTIKFSIPDEEHIGSGLTIITGANNAGKNHYYRVDSSIYWK